MKTFRSPFRFFPFVFFVFLLAACQPNNTITVQVITDIESSVQYIYKLIEVGGLTGCEITVNGSNNTVAKLTFSEPIKLEKTASGDWTAEFDSSIQTTIDPTVETNCENPLQIKTSYNDKYLETMLVTAPQAFEGEYAVGGKKTTTYSPFSVCTLLVGEVTVSTGGVRVLPADKVSLIKNGNEIEIKGIFDIEENLISSCQQIENSDEPGDTSLLQVHVTNKNGEDIEGAEVMLSFGGQPPIVQITKSNGIAIFQNLEDFKLAQIEVEKLGFKNYSLNISSSNLDGFPIPVLLESADN